MYFRSRECYDLNFWVFIQRLKNITYFRIVASNFCTRIKFPYVYFTNFLKDILKNNNKELHSIVDLTQDKSCSYKFCYGYDEYFINKYILYDAVVKGMTILYNLDFHLSNIFWKVFKKFDRETKKGAVLTSIQKRLLKDFIPNYDFQKNFSDNYTILEHSKTDNDFKELFIKYINKLEKNGESKNMFIDKVELDCLNRGKELNERYGFKGNLFSIIKYDSNLVLHKRWIHYPLYI